MHNYETYIQKVDILNIRLVYEHQECAGGFLPLPTVGDEGAEMEGKANKRGNEGHGGRLSPSLERRKWLAGTNVLCFLASFANDHF